MVYKTGLLIILSAFLLNAQILLKPNRASFLNPPAAAGGGASAFLLPGGYTTSIDVEGTDDWINQGNIIDINDTYTAITDNGYDAGDYSYYFYCYGFEFDSYLPDPVTIDSMRVSLAIYTSSGVQEVVELFSHDEAGAKCGTNMASTPVQVAASTVDTVFFSGSLSDWGRSGLTRDSVTAAAFGVGFQVLNSQNNADILADYISIRIYYTE